MKQVYLLLLFACGFQGRFLAQQTADPYQKLHEKIWGERKGRIPAQGQPFMTGMIVPASKAGKPVGIPVASVPQQELKSSCVFFGGDSLSGFDFEAASNKALNDGCKMLSEFQANVAQQQIQYIQKKFNIPSPALKTKYDDHSGSALQQSMPSLCSNVDFEDGNLGGWTAVSGYNVNSNNPLTVPNSAFTVAVTATDQNINSCADVNLITAAYGNDPVGAFPGKDPNGGSYSARLGGFQINTAGGYGFLCQSQKWNNGSYANGEFLEKTIFVTAANSLLSFDFAVVLNDGGHPNGQQPYFHVFVTNTAGAVLSSCTQYYVQATAGVPPAGFTNSGFVNNYDNSALYYKGWTANSINLTPYIGQNVKIRFVAAGCAAGAHMGWAYVDAICENADINTSNATPCLGTSVVLTAPPVAGGTYLWSGPGVNGITGQAVTVNTSATYTVVVTPSQGAACSYTLTRTVSFFNPPTVNPVVSNSLNCTSTTAQITLNNNAASPGYNTTGPGVIGGANSSVVTVNAGGTYNYVVTDLSTGCSTSGNVNVSQNTTPPNVSATVASSLNCSNLNTNITISTNATSGTYNTTGPGVVGGANSNVVTVNAGGNYNYTFTDASNNCSASGVINVAQNTTPLTVNATANQSLNCTNTTAVITLNNNNTGGATYNTTGPGVVSGGNNISVTVNAGGNYNYSVTDNTNGCVTTGVINIAQNTTPVNVSASVTNSLNCNSTTAQIGLSTNASPASFITTGTGIIAGANSSSVTVNQGGTFNYTVTNTFNNCKFSGSINVAQNTTAPNASVTPPGVLTCNTTTTNLIGNPSSGGFTYNWTGPGGFTSASSSNVVNLSGTYNLTVTNTSNGCKGTASGVVNSNTTPPNVTIDPPAVIDCNNSSITLAANPNSGATYTWTGPNSFGSTSSSPSVFDGGVYTVTVTSNANGCKGTQTVNVQEDTNPPVMSITSSGSITCTNQNVTLTGNPGSGVTYQWSGPNGFNSTNGVVTATTVGNFFLNVTSNANGCSSSSVISISANVTTPTLSATSQTAASGCGSSSVVVLSGTATPSGSTYTWTSSGTFASGVNNYSVAANSATTYTLNSSHPATGCQTSLVYTVVSNAGSPTVTAMAPTSATITCTSPTQSTSVNTNPSTNVTYAWSGPGIVGPSNTASVTGNVAGTYNLLVTNTVNACTTGSLSFVITANNSPVSPNAAITNSVNCSSTNATITTAPSPSGTFLYNWNTGSSGSSIVVSPTVNTSYVVTVTNTANGCTGSQTINAIASTTVPTSVNVTPSNFTVSCATPSTMLSASATGASTYSWITSGGSFLTSTSQSTVNIQGGGTYSVLAIGANGCSAAAAVATITPDSNLPQVSASNTSPSVTCNSSLPANTTTLTVTSGTVQTYAWSPASGVSAPASSAVSFNAPGTYTCILTAPNGCTNSINMTVGTATTAPTFVAGTGTAQALSCTNSVVTIAPTFTPSSNLSYTWTGSGISGSANNSSVNVTQAGTYSLSVTNTLTGCSSTSLTVQVNGGSTIPSVSVASTSSLGITCNPNSSTVTLSASGAAGLTYTWSTNENTSSITTSVAGTYTLNFTDPASGCSSSTVITVQNNSNGPALSSSANGALPCGGGSTTLTASSTNTNVAYAWNGPSVISGSNTANAVVGAAGIYTVTVTDMITSCVSSSTVAIAQSTVSAVAAADFTTGAAPLNVNFSSTASGATTYSWSFGNGSSSSQTNPSQTFATPGTYTVVLYSQNGACAASDTLVIKVLQGLGDIPEVFTPNGDGKNDVFDIKGLDAYPNNSLQVFNRWGNPVYIAKPYKNDWDGTPNAAGKTGSGKLPTATYFYILDLGEEKDNQIFRGFIQIQY